MKALTICQPYAHLICASRVKRVENRTWPTRYRGPILIHAGKSREWLWIETVDGVETELEANIPLAQLPFGAIVGAATLVDCLRMGDIEAGKHDGKYPWLRTHAHASGPWCWILANRCAFAEPVPYKGAQGLFDIPDAVVAAQVEQLKRERRTSGAAIPEKGSAG